MWWGDHEPCDWGWPTSRWTPGTIVHDVVGLRPPAHLVNGPVDIVTSVMLRNDVLAKPLLLAPIMVEKKSRKRTR
jgi:hypothetical protein